MCDSETGPTMAAVKIGSRCPQCDADAISRHFVLVHWVIAIGLFPFGFLSLLRPWFRCESCGCMFRPNWLKLAPQEQLSGKACWFCSDAAADKDQSVPVYLNKGKQEKVVDVPCCAFCASVHEALLWPSVIGAFVGLVMALLIAMSETGFCFGFTLAFVLCPVGWFLGRMVGRKIREARVEAVGLRPRPQSDGEKYPAVLELLGQRWELGSAIPDDDPPKQCPVCNSDTRKQGTLATLSSLTVSNRRVSIAQKCYVCGSWGCRECMHFHGQNNDVIWKGESSRDNRGQVVHYKDPKWRHHACCECGFGVVNGRSVPMD
jgi:hypothetical protein